MCGISVPSRYAINKLARLRLASCACTRPQSLVAFTTLLARQALQDRRARPVRLRVLWERQVSTSSPGNAPTTTQLTSRPAVRPTAKPSSPSRPARPAAHPTVVRSAIGKTKSQR